MSLAALRAAAAKERGARDGPDDMREWLVRIMGRSEDRDDVPKPERRTFQFAVAIGAHNNSPEMLQSPPFSSCSRHDTVIEARSGRRMIFSVS